MKKFSILEPQPEELFKKYVENNVRADQRKLNEMRELKAMRGAIANAHGSSRISLGNTTVICGIKGELTKPSPEDPGKGFIIPNVDLPALCSPIYKSGAPSEKAQTATKFLDNLIKSTNIVDTEELCISRDIWVWVLYADIVCINYDGNLHDACVTALLMALADVKLPIVKVNEEDETIETDISTTFSLNMQSIPVSSTFAVYNQYLLRDPTRTEEDMTTGLMTFVVDQYSNIIYSEKIGGDSMKAEKLAEIQQQARDHATIIRKRIPIEITPAKTQQEKQQENGDDCGDGEAR